MRVLVTGASGFVGQGLVPYLIGQGHDVVAATRDVSKISAGTAVSVSEVGPNTDWSQALQGIEAIVHLAARAHVLKEEAADPLAEHRRVNTEGTRRLAEQAVASGVKRFVFLSSIGVLGNDSLASKNGRAYTEADVANPHDDYSKSKWEAEQTLASISGIEKVIIRPPLIYGPGVPGNFRKLLGLAKNGRPFPLGGVKNARSLIGRENLCSLLACVVEDDRPVGETYVVADDETLSTAQLYQSLCRDMGVRSRLLNVPEPILRALLKALGKGKMATRLCDTLVVDSSKAREQLGWKQARSLEDGLKETAENFRGEVYK